MTREFAPLGKRDLKLQDVTAVLVHPDITFPSMPSNLTPLNPKSIKKTQNSQMSLYRDLSSILHREGHYLAIDTTENLNWWSRMASSFAHPVVLVHSLKTAGCSKLIFSFGE